MVLGNDYEDYDSGTFRSTLQQQRDMPAIGWNLMHVAVVHVFASLPQGDYVGPDNEPIPADDFICAYCAGGEL